jgi:hypothetical protein
MTFEVVMAVKVSVFVFCSVTLCGLVSEYQRLYEPHSIFRVGNCLQMYKALNQKENIDTTSWIYTLIPGKS